MSTQLIALMFGAGVGGWTYYMMMRYTGGQAKPSWIMTIIAGATGFFVFYSMFAWVFKF